MKRIFAWATIARPNYQPKFVIVAATDDPSIQTAAEAVADAKARTLEDTSEWQFESIAIVSSQIETRRNIGDALLSLGAPESQKNSLISQFLGTINKLLREAESAVALAGH